MKKPRNLSPSPGPPEILEKNSQYYAFACWLVPTSCAEAPCGGKHTIQRGLLFVVGCCCWCRVTVDRPRRDPCGGTIIFDEIRQLAKKSVRTQSGRPNLGLRALAREGEADGRHDEAAAGELARARNLSVDEEVERLHFRYERFIFAPKNAIFAANFAKFGNILPNC